MFFFGRKQRQANADKKDLLISELQKDYRKNLVVLDETTHETEEMNKRLEKGGTAEIIFLATGGARRNGKH